MLDEGIEKSDENESSDIRIDKIKLTSYRFFNEEVLLDCKSRSVLIYGGNGTGKSSIYKALELLIKKDIKSLDRSRNIFNEQNPEIEFTFSNTENESLILTPQENENIYEGYPFLSGLSIFSPMIDYKKLLKIHYSSANGDKQVNVFNMFKVLFKDYPIPAGDKVLNLSEIKDPLQYSETLKAILNTVLLKDINGYLDYFDKDFHIEEFKFGFESTQDNLIEPTVNIKIKFKDTLLEDTSHENYHSFLNEARLSALAISIYFASIRLLNGVLNRPSLKILVLDDIIISLDMKNRQIILDILNNKFSDFQIFFFTHDSVVFELFQTNTDWLAYTINHDLTSGKITFNPPESPLQQARRLWTVGKYKNVGNPLRQFLEEIIEKYLKREAPPDIFKKTQKLFQRLNLAMELVKDQSTKELLGEIQYRDRICVLNPASHGKIQNIEKDDVEKALDRIEKLGKLLK